MVLNVADGQVGVHHLRHLPCITACCIDDGFRNDDAFLGHYLPFTGRQRIDIDNTVMPDDPGAHIACAASHRVGKTRRISMAVVARQAPARTPSVDINGLSFLIWSTPMISIWNPTLSAIPLTYLNQSRSRSVNANRTLPDVCQLTDCPVSSSSLL